jgi:hypothetical protein
MYGSGRWFLSGLLIVLYVATAFAGPEITQAASAGKDKGVFKVLDPRGVISTKETAIPPAGRLKSLARKRVWVVVVDYNSTLMPAVTELLPGNAPGIRLKTIQAGDAGNPFFMLKPEDKPDAVIIGTGVCEATIPEAMNYAKQAEKMGIPVVISYFVEMYEVYRQWTVKLQFPGIRACATVLPDPARQEDPARLARKLVPQFIEGLTRPIGDDRPRIYFTGSMDKAQSLFEAAQWTGGLPVILPTEERVIAMLKATLHRPDEVIGVMMPGMRKATVEKVAVNMVMAGGRPEQFPVALAVAEAMCRPGVAEALSGRGAPFLKIAAGGSMIKVAGTMGNPDDDIIGRAMRLMLINLAGVPGMWLEKKRFVPTVFEEINSDESTAAFIGGDKDFKDAEVSIGKWL